MGMDRDFLSSEKARIKMVWETAALSFSLAALSVIWLGLLWRFFVLREEFEVKARSPFLVVVAMGTCYLLCMSVLIHWLLRSLGRTLPCYVVFVMSYGVLAFGTVPYLIRAVRLVVAYSKEYRAKYAKFVKKKRIMQLWGAMIAGLVVRAFLFFGKNPEHLSRDARDCFYVDDTLLLGGILLFGGGPGLILACKIFRVNDAFKLRDELLFVIVGCNICATTLWTLQVLVVCGFLPDAEAIHVAVEVLALLFGLNGGTFGLLVPMARAHRGGLRSWTRAAVVPVEGTGFTDLETASGVDGVLALATTGGETADLFKSLCRRHLTLENWDFILASLHYESTDWGNPDAQFNAFVRVLNRYLLPVSPDEVNIESKMSKHLASLGSRDCFAQLEADARKNVLREPLNEIVRVLEQNLLSKFRRSVALQKESLLAEATKGDAELMEMMRVSCQQSSSRPASR